MPQLMPGTGGASCRQIHCVCASWPAAGRTATFCAGRVVSAHGKGLVGTGERGQCLCQRAGGHWEHDFTNMGGQLGVENLATKRSRSMVRTDQLPWGESGEEGVRPAGVTLSPPLARAWPHWPVTHQLSAKLWCLLPCPPRTHPRDMRAESSGALTQPGLPCVPHHSLTCWLRWAVSSRILRLSAAQHIPGSAPQ